MNSLRVEALWEPRPGYPLTPEEASLHRATVGSMVWRNPSFGFVEQPTPDPGDDDLLIRVKRCGICGSDTHLYENDTCGYIIFSGPARMPCTIGHEYSGVVEAVGKGVGNFKVGDRVAAESIGWCGRCTPCRSGAVNQCERIELFGITVDGALADLVRVREHHCWKIDPLLERFTEEEMFDLGALLEPVGCAYNGMFVSAGGFKPGAVVAVYGAGPIGLGAVALARVAGASLVIAFDIMPHRLELARKLGADYVFNTSMLTQTGSSPAQEVNRLTGGKGADINVEAAGVAPLTIPEMENSLAANGKIVYLGRAATATPIQLNRMVSGASAIVGARGHSGYGIYPNLIRLMASGRLQVREMITAYYDFPQALEALRKSTERIDGKIMVRMG